MVFSSSKLPDGKICFCAKSDDCKKRPRHTARCIYDSDFRVKRCMYYECEKRNDCLRKCRTRTNLWKIPECDENGKCRCFKCQERMDCRDICKKGEDFKCHKGGCKCNKIVPQPKECTVNSDCKRCRTQRKIGSCKNGKCVCIACDEHSDCKDLCYDLGRPKYDCDEESGRCKCLKECSRSRHCKKKCRNEGKLGACNDGKCVCLACNERSDCKDLCYDLGKPKYDCDEESGRCKCLKECNRNRDCKERCRNRGKLGACNNGECVCKNCVRTSDCDKFCRDSERPRHRCDEEDGKCKCLKKLRVNYLN